MDLELADGHLDRWTDRPKDGWLNGWTDRQMDGWLDAPMDGQSNIPSYRDAWTHLTGCPKLFGMGIGLAFHQLLLHRI